MRPIACVLILLFFAAALCGGAQSKPSGETPAPPTKSVPDPQLGQRRNATHDDEMIRILKEQEKQRNKDRHAALKKDTDRLLELATELKLYVDKSNENTLSLEVIKKAETIEKLARSVKEKMKGM